MGDNSRARIRDTGVLSADGTAMTVKADVERACQVQVRYTARDEGDIPHVLREDVAGRIQEEGQRQALITHNGTRLRFETRGG